MTKSKMANRYSPEVRARAVRMVFEHQGSYETQAGAIAPSTYYHHLACRADPSKASARDQRDAELRPETQRVWNDNYQVYGVRKAWHQLKLEGFEVARCTVQRL